MNELAATVRVALARIAQAFFAPQQMWQWLALAAACAVAWIAARIVRRLWAAHHQESGGQSHGLEAATLGRMTLAATIAIAALAGSATLAAARLPHPLLDVAAALAGGMLVIRIVVYTLRRILRPGPLLTASLQLATWVVWIFFALLLLGWLQPLGRALDALAITVGTSRVSVLDAIRAVATLLLAVVLAAYVGAVLENRILAASNVSIGVRVGLGKTVRFGLILLALLLAVNALGVELGGLTVFGGALGVGIGFGLQRIASNFVSGFILIADRSIRPGDVITIDNRFGVVRELRARYVVVRDRDGVDTLIPNENIVTSQVVNWSYADRVVRLKLPVQISYHDNPRQAMSIMLKAAQDHPRVERTPEAAVRITNFGDNGIELELRFWIKDPEDGINNVRSDLYLAVWDAFGDAGITIPYPQRDLHLRSGEWGAGTRPRAP